MTGLAAPFSILFCVTLIATAEAIVFPKQPTVIEISTRPWLYELSAKYGRAITSLSDIPDAELAGLRAQGADIVWFMGVWRVGAYGVQHDRTDASLVAHFKELLPDYTASDAIGSPYSAVNYTCNPELCPGGDGDLEVLRARLHRAGLGLMLDFIPNHSSCDSTWLAAGRVDLYVRAPKTSGPPYDRSKYLESGVAYGNCPYSAPWTDVAQLNYWNPATRELMREQLVSVAKRADAVRCDMAYIVLNDLFGDTWRTELEAWAWARPADEFWPAAIAAARAANPGVVFLAETYGDSYAALQDQGFDYTYDKELLDRLRDGHLDRLREWIAHVGARADKMCHFVENHDEDRAVATIGTVRRADAAAVLALTLPGMRLLFQDQNLGYANKLDVHLRRARAEAAAPEARAFYANFSAILGAPAFRDGAWAQATVTGSDAWHFVAWTWQSPAAPSKRLVVVNYSKESAWASVVVPDVSGSGYVPVKELFSGVTYSRSAEEMRSTGITVGIDSESFQIFEYY